MLPHHRLLCAICACRKAAAGLRRSAGGAHGALPEPWTSMKPSVSRKISRDATSSVLLAETTVDWRSSRITDLGSECQTLHCNAWTCRQFSCHLTISLHSRFAPGSIALTHSQGPRLHIALDSSAFNGRMSADHLHMWSLECSMRTCHPRSNARCRSGTRCTDDVSTVVMCFACKL